MSNETGTSPASQIVYLEKRVAELEEQLDALTQKPEIEPVGEVVGGPDCIPHFEWTVIDRPPAGTKLYTSPQPSAQVPEGWKMVPNSDIGQWLENISEHGLPVGPHSFMLRTILNLAPAAPSLEKPEWIRCEDELPTGDEEFTWVRHPDGRILLTQTSEVRWLEHGCSWLPTGLQRPEPPEGE